MCGDNCGCQLDSAYTEVGQQITWRLVVWCWLPILIFKLSDTLKRHFWCWWWYTPPGCKPYTSEPILCYKASLIIKQPHKNKHIRSAGVLRRRVWVFISPSVCVVSDPEYFIVGWIKVICLISRCRAISRQTRWGKQLTGYPLGGRTRPAAHMWQARP